MREIYFLWAQLLIGVFCIWANLFRVLHGDVDWASFIFVAVSIPYTIMIIIKIHINRQNSISAGLTLKVSVLSY